MRASSLATACGRTRTPPIARQSLGACEPLFVPVRNPGLLLYTLVVRFVVHVTKIGSDWVMCLCHFRFLLTSFISFLNFCPTSFQVPVMENGIVNRRRDSLFGFSNLTSQLHVRLCTTHAWRPQLRRMSCDRVAVCLAPFVNLV